METQAASSNVSAPRKSGGISYKTGAYKAKFFEGKTLAELVVFYNHLIADAWAAGLDQNRYKPVIKFSDVPTGVKRCMLMHSSIVARRTGLAEEEAARAKEKLSAKPLPAQKSSPAAKLPGKRRTKKLELENTAPEPATAPAPPVEAGSPVETTPELATTETEAAPPAGVKTFDTEPLDSMTSTRMITVWNALVEPANGIGIPAKLRKSTWFANKRDGVAALTKLLAAFHEKGHEPGWTV